MMQGASLVSSQYRSEFFTPELQQDALPPGLLEHSAPPHAPQLVEQQTLLLALMPGISPPAVGQVWPVDLISGRKGQLDNEQNTGRSE